MFQKQTLFIALLVCVKVSLVRAEEPEHSKEKVLVVFFAAQEQSKMKTFQEVIDAYLGKYKVKLVTGQIESFPSNTTDQIGAARKQIESTSSTGALWIDFEKQTVNILIIRQGTDLHTSGGEQILTRSFPNLEQGWRTECEAMAAFVRFALSSWLEEPSLQKEDSDQNFSIQALDDESPWPAAPAQNKEDPVPFAVLSASTSYTVNWTGGSDLIQQGASISTIVTFLDLWIVFLGVDILNYYDPANSENTLHRLPLFIGSGLFWGTSKWKFGFNLAFETDVVYFSIQNVRTFHRYNPGLDVSFVIRSKISKMLTLFVSFGTNIYLNDYSEETQNTFDYNGLQPQLCLGLEVWRFWKSGQ